MLYGQRVDVNGEDGRPFERIDRGRRHDFCIFLCWESMNKNYLNLLDLWLYGQARAVREWVCV